MKKILFSVILIGSAAHAINQQQLEKMDRVFAELNDKSAAKAKFCEIASGATAIGAIALFTSSRLKSAMACYGLSRFLHYYAKLKHDEVRERNQFKNNIALMEFLKTKENNL